MRPLSTPRRAGQPLAVAEVDVLLLVGFGFCTVDLAQLAVVLR